MSAASQRPTSAPAGFWNKLLGILDLTHPFPMIMNALLAGLFMYMASPNVAFGRLLVLVLSVAGIHGSFGSLNDYCDYPLDKVTKPAKPLVRALTTRRFALLQALILAVAGLSLSWALNWLTACVAAIMLGTGVWYDLWAKGTLLSWMPYAVFIPSLPLWGFAAAGRFESVLLLAYPLGVLLSLGLNVANTLPDRDDDVAYGLRGLVHRLERTPALLLAWSSFAGAMLGFAVVAPLAHNDWAILGPGLVLGVLLLLFMIGDYVIFRSPQSLKRNWYASALLSAVAGLAWVASLPHR
jgi:4-hydroxybenzoate polyprenyltransferase